MAAHNPPAQHRPPPTAAHDSGIGGGGADEHESAIKTPRQLITVVALSFIVPIIVIILLANFVTAGNRTGAGTAALTPESIESRIRPVAGFELRAAGAATAARSGEEVYKAVCSACHLSGAANAPKTGDKAAWEPRLKQGLDSLVNAALKGKGAMPAQGGGDSSDLEVARAVVYLSNQGGASFEEPKAPAAPK